MYEGYIDSQPSAPAGVPTSYGFPNVPWPAAMSPAAPSLSASQATPTGHVWPGHHNPELATNSGTTLRSRANRVVASLFTADLALGRLAFQIREHPFRYE